MIDSYVAKLCQNDFASFTGMAFAELYPNEKFEYGWHHDAMANLLSEARSGVSPRMIINMPPRSLKSFIVSVAWPAFLFGQDPTTRIMVLSYGETLARELSETTRRLMQSPYYHQLFPQTLLVQQSALILNTRQGGMRNASSITGGVTGRGASWLIIDDSISATDAVSDVMRQKSKAVFGATVATRLNDQRTDRIIVVQQRLHEDDLTGDLIRKGGWNLLKLQARATENADIMIGPGKVHPVRIGDLLQPLRQSAAILARLETEMGSANFAAQFQQEPVPEQGNMIQRIWLRYYSVLPSFEGGLIIQSWDTATKTDPIHDYSVCTTWLKKGNMHYLLDVWRGRVNFPDLRQKAIDLWTVHRPHKVIIEDQGAGSSLIQDLSVGHGIPAIAWRCTDPKEVRLAAASSYIQAQQMHLPENAPWLAEFESELLGFPAKQHDDQVDSLSQYFGWVRENTRRSTFANTGGSGDGLGLGLAKRLMVFVARCPRREEVGEAGQESPQRIGLSITHGRSPVDQASFGRTDNTLAMKM
ncbi:MAG: phage terminase large subunit [Sphingomonadaceae bacterium]